MSLNPYIIEPKRRIDLSISARQLRMALGVDEDLMFPVVEQLDRLVMQFPPFEYEIVEPGHLGENVHADTDVINHLIRIDEDVYLNAVSGKGRDRMTIAHEFGHYFTICINGYRLQRNFSNRPLRPFEDPEWQAKCFAGELLIPRHLVRNLSALEISEKCGVSFDAACYQRKIYSNGGIT